MGDARLDQIDAEVAKTKQGVAQAICKYRIYIRVY